MEELESAIEKNLALSTSKSLSQQAIFSVKNTLKSYAAIFEHGMIPEKGWSEMEIEKFLLQISSMDSNNFPHNIGVGEREGRVICPLVFRRHFGFSHGIGRSGNVSEVQPKAAGSALLYGLVNRMVRHALLIARFHKLTVSKCSVFPVATGMAMQLVFQTLRISRPSARYVAWMRVDQKSCLKAITSAGFIPIVIDNDLIGEELQTSIVNLTNALDSYRQEDILCVVSCSSCFAPRAFDNIPEIGIFCRERNIPHVVNNAYGIQSSRAVHLLNETVRLNARLDIFVQSTDKNFLVPVGGSIIASPNAKMVEAVESIYPGRASFSQVIDIASTFLYLGSSGLEKLLQRRKDIYSYFKQALVREGFEMLNTPHNDISIAIKMTASQNSIGGHLFVKGVSGARFVVPGTAKSIDGIHLKSFGAHHDSYPHSYLTVAAAIGMQQEEVDEFLKILKRLT